MKSIKIKNKYQNLQQIKMEMSVDKAKNMLKDYAKKEQRVPPVELPTKEIDSALFESGDSVVWLGHSTILARIDGINIIVDPMFSHRASPVNFVGPKRFEGSLIDVETLPNIDIILITHNHYDHMDKSSILYLHEKVKKIFIPLDNKETLKCWGVETEKIVEFDWGDEHQLDHTSFILAPTQHFSGRGLTDRDLALWGSWVIKGIESSLYVSGDSGYNTHFAEISKAYGEFDLVCMECGAYNDSWSEVHMRPEESVQAAIDLKAKVMLPMHWAGFNLSTHAWDEPIQRALSHSSKLSQQTTTPMIGEVVALHQEYPQTKWWEDVRS